MIPGLRNPGNTCFFNSVLQALASSEALREYLRLVATAAETAHSTVPPLLRSLRDCLESLQPNATSTRTVDSEDVLSAVGDQHGDVLSSGDQHDAAEALQLLMDGVGDQMRHWVAGSLQHELQTPSLLHLPAISQLPACTGYQAAELPSAACLFHKWRELTQLPLGGTLRDESTCLSCRTTAECQYTPFTLLTLPIAKTVQQSLEGFSAFSYLHRVECTRCSLRASLRDWHPEVRPGGMTNDTKYTKQSTAKASEAEELARLQRLAAGSSPLPAVDFARQLAALGLPWRQRKTSRLKRCCIAKAPQVLGLHFRRVQWTVAGRQIKVPGHISFPATLPAAALEAAVPVTRGTSADVLPPLTLPAELRGAQPPPSPQLPRTPQSEQHSPMAATSCGPNVLTVSEPLLHAEAYTLTAVVQHHGGPESGHYTTLRRIAAAADGAPLWFSTSDASVRRASEQEALDAEATLLLFCRNV